MLDGRSRPKGKRSRKDYLVVTGIVAAGMVLAVMARSQRGQMPAILGALAILVATCYWHRRNPAAVALLVGVVPVVLILGMALASTPATKPHAVKVAKASSAYSGTVSAGAVTTAGDVAGWVAERTVALVSGLVKP